MKYKLNERYLIREWERLSNCLLDKRSNQVIVLPRKVYSALASILENGGSEGVPPFLTGMLLTSGILQQAADNEPTLLEEQAHRAYPSRYIKSALWSITGKCNYHCRHCYMSAPEGKLGELPFEACCDIIRQLEECGVRQVSLTGGEPLVRKDFFGIVDAILDAGISIKTIYSNGHLVTQAFLEELESREIKPEINFSFDGTDGAHEWLRNVAGSEERVLHAIDLCKEADFPVGAEMCLTKRNIGTLRSTVNLLSKHGASSLKVSPAMAAGEWLKQPSSLAPTVEEVAEAYLEYLPCYVEDGMPLRLMLSELFYSNGDGTYAIPMMKQVSEEACAAYCLCGHARQELYISADGRWTPCMPLSSNEGLSDRFPKWNEIPLKQALSDSFYLSCIETTLDKYLEANEECARCRFKLDCASGCRGRAASAGNYLSPDCDMCALFQNGYPDKVTRLMTELGVPPVR